MLRGGEERRGTRSWRERWAVQEDRITEGSIDAATEIHRSLGPGLLEKVYGVISAHELRRRGFEVEQEFVTETPTVVEPTLAAALVGACFQIVSAFDDDGDPQSEALAGTYRDGYGTVTCLDSRTGELLWEEEFGEGFYSSPVVVGDRVYLMDRSGVMRVFAAAGEYRPLGNPSLGESSTVTGAFLDGRIYLRGESHLFCIGEGP